MGGRIFDAMLYLIIGAAVVAIPVSLIVSVASFFGF
jgi:hypothetical protein